VAAIGFEPTTKGLKPVLMSVELQDEAYFSKQYVMGLI
jgi:hypothetical protein